MSSGIPLDTNYRNLSCQLGGLTLNGNVSQGTANTYNIVTINDPNVIIDSSKNIIPGKFLQVNVSGTPFFIPLYQ
jgi:hypothetical protein